MRGEKDAAFVVTRNAPTLSANGTGGDVAHDHAPRRRAFPRAPESSLTQACPARPRPLSQTLNSELEL